MLKPCYREKPQFDNSKASGFPSLLLAYEQNILLKLLLSLLPPTPKYIISCSAHSPGAAAPSAHGPFLALITPPFSTTDVSRILSCWLHPTKQTNSQTLCHLESQRGASYLFIRTLSFGAQLVRSWLSLYPRFRGSSRSMVLLEHFQVECLGSNPLARGLSTKRRKPAFWLQVSTIARMVMRPRNLMSSLYSCLHTKLCLGHRTAT